MLDKLLKRVCRTAGPTLAASFEHWVHYRNVASLSLFYRYCFGRCSSELAELHDFSLSISRCYKDVMPTVSFLAQLGSGVLCLKNGLFCPMI